MPSPDGMTLDEEGNIFVAMWGIGEVWKIDKDANLLKKFKQKVSILLMYVLAERN